MKKQIAIISISFGVIFLSGCTAKLAPESKIPPAPKVAKMNHKLTIDNQREIQNKYFEYQDNIIMGVASLASNAIDRSNYYDDLKSKDVDMSHEKIYDCKISQIFGDFSGKYFHDMFVVSNIRTTLKNVSVALNKNNVNEFIVYKDNSIYDHKDGGYGLAIIDNNNSNSNLNNVIAIRYKCKKVPNTIFQPDNHRPVYE